MSEAVWRALAERALGGKPIEALHGATSDGLPIAPLYQRSRAEPWPAPRAPAESAKTGSAPTGSWGIVQRVDHPDPEQANRIALLDLEGGATALSLVFAGETARGFGLPLAAEALATALAGVELDFIGLRLDAGGQALEASRLLAEITTARRLTSASLDIDLGLDPIGYRARAGAAMPADPTGPDLAALLEAHADAGFAGRAFLADARPYHEAGAGEAQELAAVLATGLAYLRRLEQAGLPLADAAAEIAVLLVADADTFVTIAKFRAARRLWARIEEACGLAPRPLRLHAETAWRMMTRRDPWANVMRATAATFAAGIGGADTIAVLPFTLPLGLPEDGACRLARNTGLVLLDEAHLAKVEDPAAGSGGIESLTDTLCARAWEMFQEIEREGGIEASLAAGALRARIAETAARRARAIATMIRPITGTSAFPTLAEASPALAEARRQAPRERGPLALPATRDAEPFEALRDRADALADTRGRRPTVALATLGSPAEHGPRALFAANFLAAGGIATLSLPVDAGRAAYDLADTPVACLCAPDPLLGEPAADAIRGLRAAGTRRVLLAGKPALAERLGDAGVDGFIHQGCDMLAVLSDVLASLEDGSADDPALGEEPRV